MGRGDTPRPAEGEKKLRNWHLTETGSGATSVGVTEDEPGFYPSAEGQTATAIVAPGDFVEKYVHEHGGDKFTDDVIREAIRAWDRGNARAPK